MVTTCVCLYLLFFTQHKWIPLLYASWYIYDFDTCNKGGREFRYMRRWFLFDYFVRYFPIQLIKTADLDPSKSYLIGSHPHGIICFGAFGSFATDALHWDQMFPGLQTRLLTLEQNFWLPGTR